MTYFDAPAARTGAHGLATLWAVLTAPFRAFGRLLIAMADASDRMEQVRRLQAMSDEDLAALGTTRADEVKRMFASSGAV